MHIVVCLEKDFLSAMENPSRAHRSLDVRSHNELNLCKPTTLSFDRVAPLRAIVRREDFAFDKHFGRDLTVANERTNELTPV